MNIIITIALVVCYSCLYRKVYKGVFMSCRNGILPENKNRCTDQMLHLWLFLPAPQDSTFHMLITVVGIICILLNLDPKPLWLLIFHNSEITKIFITEIVEGHHSLKTFLPKILVKLSILYILFLYWYIHIFFVSQEYNVWRVPRKKTLFLLNPSKVQR